MVPLLLIIAAIGAGTRPIAAEEEQGAVDLLLANPVSRPRIVLEKTAALASEIAILAVVLWLSLLVGVETVGMDVSAAHLAAATASAALLALGFGAIALLVGAASGRRSTAIGLAAAGAVAAYLVNSLAVLVDFLEPVRRRRPSTTTSRPTRCAMGWQVDHIAVLFLVALTATGLAVYSLDRRDLAA
jgi:ABC-2 type transport system permease protein